MAKRPRFSTVWAASGRIYDPAQPATKVANVIGGKVAANINASPPHNWSNTCAVRMSYMLNQAGVRIPFQPQKTVSGASGRWYFYRVKDLIAFLRGAWGKPDLTVKYPPRGGGAALSGKKGVILFEVSGWSDAAGHATLWNGNICYDHCYFNEPGVLYRTNRANFWSLN